MATDYEIDPKVECTDECSMVTDDGGWTGRESECGTKKVRYYGQIFTVSACPVCGEDVRELDAGLGPDPDAAAERRQMGISAL